MTIAQPAHPSTEDQDHRDHDERPHACNDGWVSLEVETDEGTLEEVLYLCQRCSQRS